jgi:hypothetical protein
MRRAILDDPLYAPVHRFVRDVPWDVVYSLPLVSRGRALGAVFFCFLPGGEPGEDERTFLRAIADQAAIAVENAGLLAEAREKAPSRSASGSPASCTTPSPRRSTG